MEEQKDLEHQEPVKRGDDGVRVSLSRDKKWLLIRAPGLENPIIKAVAYFEKIIERARTGTGYNIEQIKE
jgi:hypothetical protein